jgi:uncharacterized NAD-dependent epimerase/dehydratase family protein
MDGNAIVYCEGAFGSPNGKTAHGLVRRSGRYRILSVVDSGLAGGDAGSILDGRPAGVPVVASIDEALSAARRDGVRPTHLVVGLAPDGGRLSGAARRDVALALERGLNVDSGLHDFLSEDPDLVALASRSQVVLRDVRKPPARDDLHFFSGKIEEVTSFRVALLGTDSAVGKRTTAWRLVDACEAAGLRSELIGTGQTAWLQGARYGIVVDSIVSDFVAGEIEHAVWSAWTETDADVLVLEGQGSLMNPAYPGGFELLAAGRPDVVIMQHAPSRRDYDGFPGYPIHPLTRQIEAVEMISGKPVVAVTLNHEGIERDDIPRTCADVSRETGLPVVDVLINGAGRLVDCLQPHLENRGESADV